jgi:hypothetical protein
VGGHPFAAAVSMLLVPMAPPGAEPLDIIAVDTSALPRVALEIVAPVRFSAEPITPATVDVDGKAVESVTAIDPDDVVVGLVIDDRPAVAPAIVAALQGAAVELVRNSRDGIEVSLGTPSGLRTALTSDRDANIARIAAITAGSPAVVSLTDVVTGTIAELAASDATDRHAVVVLGGAIDAEADLAGIADALTASGTVLNVVAPTTTDAGALARIAERSGGEVSASAEVLASVDEVTAMISNRYRVVANVAGSGPHRVGFELDGQRFSADFDVPSVAAEPSSPSTPSVTTPAQARKTPGAVAGSTPGTIVDQTASPQSLDVAPPAEGGGLPTGTIMLAALALAVVVLVVAGVMIVVRRRTGGDDGEPYVIKKPPESKPVTKPAPRPAYSPAPKPVSKPAPKVVTSTKAGPRPPRPTPGSTNVPVRRQPPPVTPLPRRPPRPTPEPRRVEPPKPAEPPASGSPGDGTEWIVAGDLRVSPTRGEAWSGDRRVDLTPAELRVLELLITSGDRGVTREELAEAGELDDSRVGPDAVDAIVTQVRRKTGIRGRGHAVRKERVVTYFLE